MDTSYSNPKKQRLMVVESDEELPPLKVRLVEEEPYVLLMAVTEAASNLDVNDEYTHPHNFLVPLSEIPKVVLDFFMKRGGQLELDNTWEGYVTLKGGDIDKYPMGPSEKHVLLWWKDLKGKNGACATRPTYGKVPVGKKITHLLRLRIVESV